MKKNYIISFALLVSCICAFAQPVLEEGNFPTNYSADVYVINNVNIIDDFDGILPGNQGINQVWDFSALGLPVTPNGTYTVVPVSTVLNVDFFPSANYCVKTNNLSLDENEDVYQIYNISSSGIVLLGNSSDFGVVECRDNSFYFPFPYLFNTAISGTQNCGVPFPYEFTATYDAYGTLLTSFGVFQDVIRKKTVSDDGFNYAYIRANPFSVIMELNISANGDAVIYAYKETTALNVSEVNKAKAITAYPNPSSSILNIQLSNKNSIDKVVITDLTGKIVLLQNQNTDQINVQNLLGGMYILQVLSGEEKFHTKFIKE